MLSLLFILPIVLTTVVRNDFVKIPFIKSRLNHVSYLLASFLLVIVDINYDLDFEVYASFLLSLFAIEFNKGKLKESLLWSLSLVFLSFGRTLSLTLSEIFLYASIFLGVYSFYFKRILPVPSLGFVTIYALKSYGASDLMIQSGLLFYLFYILYACIGDKLVWRKAFVFLLFLYTPELTSIESSLFVRYPLYALSFWLLFRESKPLNWLLLGQVLALTLGGENRIELGSYYSIGFIFLSLLISNFVFCVKNIELNDSKKLVLSYQEMLILFISVLFLAGVPGGPFSLLLNGENAASFTFIFVLTFVLFRTLESLALKEIFLTKEEVNVDTALVLTFGLFTLVFSYFLKDFSYITLALIIITLSLFLIVGFKVKPIIASFIERNFYVLRFPLPNYLGKRLKINQPKNQATSKRFELSLSRIELSDSLYIALSILSVVIFLYWRQW